MSTSFLASRLSSARERAGLTQRQLAARLGEHQPQIARWEAGRAEPRLEALRRLAEALGVRLEELLG